MPLTHTDNGHYNNRVTAVVFVSGLVGGLKMSRGWHDVCPLLQSNSHPFGMFHTSVFLVSSQIWISRRFIFSSESTGFLLDVRFG